MLWVNMVEDSSNHKKFALEPNLRILQTSQSPTILEVQRGKDSYTMIKLSILVVNFLIS